MSHCECWGREPLFLAPIHNAASLLQVCGWEVQAAFRLSPLPNLSMEEAAAQPMPAPAPAADIADAPAPAAQEAKARSEPDLGRDEPRVGATNWSSTLASVALRVAPAPAPGEMAHGSPVLSNAINASQTDEENLESALAEYLQWGVPRPGPQAPASGPAAPNPLASAQHALHVQVGIP